jgi:hypothetical protein
VTSPRWNWLRACACVLAVLPPHAAQGQQAAADLAPLLARAGINAAPLASCRGEFRVGHQNEFAVALPGPDGGRYVIVQDDGRTQALGTFAGKPELSCYSLREADQLNDTIAKSTTMNGRVVAEWDGMVVCGFLEPTIALCWQFAPEDRAFVRIGGWTS